MLGGGGATGQEYASRSRPGGLGCAKHLSPPLLHADKAAALFTQRRGKMYSRKSIADGEWTIILRVSDSRGISVPARAKRGKMAIMRQNVDHE